MNLDWKLSFRLFLLRFLKLIALVMLAFPGLARADAFEDSARQLVRRISGTLPPGEVVVLNLRNLSSLRAAEVAVVRRALEAELESQGFRLTPSAAPASVLVTLSENLRTYVWVAEIRRGEKSELAMLAVNRLPPRTPAAPALVLRKELIFEDPAPILDFAEIGSRPGSGGTSLDLLVLQPGRMAFYEQGKQGWELRKVVCVREGNTQTVSPREADCSAPEQAWPRDLRGRIVPVGPSLEVYLPGWRCSTSLGAIALQCRYADEGTDTWPLVAREEFRLDAHLLRDRNFFTQRSVASEGPAPFYSGAAGKSGSQAYRALTHLDGRTRIYDETGRLLATVEGWGSDIAGLSTKCGSGWQMLVTRPGDWSEADFVQAYEMVDRQALAVSPVVEFSGPVTALWPASDGATADAVVHNLTAGNYEAYRLSVACGN